ncbi:MAG: hypothetical protein E7391_04250 [Ruminococcaceae bacterium]|nr:hypothetical protein [Oscillospiraceae bacterium]
MYEMLKEFIKPELLVLIPVLYLYGMALKKSEIADKNIPMILGITSIVLSLLFIAATVVITGWQGILMALFSGLTQGVLCAGASVYVHQIIKQKSKDE